MMSDADSLLENKSAIDNIICVVVVVFLLLKLLLAAACLRCLLLYVCVFIFS